MRKPIGISTDQKILKQQLRLIDTLADAMADLTRGMTSKWMVLSKRSLADKNGLHLDGLANWVSLINAQLEKGGDVVVYPQGNK
jgi:hypothetical protein